MMWLMVLIDVVWAVKTDYVEQFYGGVFGAALIVAAYAALTTECTIELFEAMKTTDWDLEMVDEHLQSIELEDPIARSGARNRLKKWITKPGVSGASSSRSAVSVKQEPSVASNMARDVARKLGTMDDDEIEAVAAQAGKNQDQMNEVIECTSGYAKAMRHCGHEGAALDKAVEGEDPETEIVKGVGSEFKIKTIGTKCVSDDWRGMDDFYLAMAQMVTRAEGDDKPYIVRRLNAISNHVHKLCMGVQLPYVKKLFKQFYKGIPTAVNETLASTVELEWRNSLSKKQGSSSGDDSKLLERIKAAENRADKAEKRAAAAEKGKSSGGGKEILCHCCHETGHIAKNCPSACKKCSKEDPVTGYWKHKHVDKCECSSE